MVVEEELEFVWDEEEQKPAMVGRTSRQLYALFDDWVELNGFLLRGLMFYVKHIEAEDERQGDVMGALKQYKKNPLNLPEIL